MKRELDIAIISDVHLGSVQCQADALLNYLKSLKTKNLIINGDFICVDTFRKNKLPSLHLDVIKEVLKIAAKGTKVYYLTGDKDDVLRNVCNFSTGTVHVRDKLLLQLNGSKYWIFHGDVFDILKNPPAVFTRLGGKGYDWLHWANRQLKKAHHVLSSTPFAKQAVVNKPTLSIQQFEKTVLQLAAQQNYDYVICGHTRQPVIKKAIVLDREVNYMNAGDWTSNLTALEYRWGAWSLYQYDKKDFDKENHIGKQKTDTLLTQPMEASPDSQNKKSTPLNQGIL